MTNLVLATMPKTCRALLSPHLEEITLPKRRNLELVRRTIEHSYFIETGIAAVISATDDHRIAVGLVGQEGASGVGIFLGDDRSPHACEMLTDGAALRIQASALKTLIREYEQLRTHLTRYALAFYNQAAHTALSNASSVIPRRIARWLLMMHDRVPGDEIALTHVTIAQMLDIRRSGVSSALEAFEEEQWIELGRGTVTVVDRKELEAVAADFYGLPEAEYRRLMGVAS